MELIVFIAVCCGIVWIIGMIDSNAQAKKAKDRQVVQAIIQETRAKQEQERRKRQSEIDKQKAKLKPRYVYGEPFEYIHTNGASRRGNRYGDDIPRVGQIQDWYGKRKEVVRVRKGDYNSDYGKNNYRWSQEYHITLREIIDTQIKEETMTNNIKGTITSFDRTGQATVVHTDNGSAATLYRNLIEEWEVGDKVIMDTRDDGYPIATLLQTSRKEI